ncbi:PAS domain-containing sensor histidine kinase [Nocardioidaceae bacterium]|nr:PAS domain-containing sensor histidine kinase [Nocardioidaceae bacterium]
MSSDAETDAETDEAPCVEHVEETLELLPEGVIVADENGRIIKVNERACRLLVRDAGDLMGTDIVQSLRLQDEHGNDWLQCMRPYTGLRTRSELSERILVDVDGTEVLASAALHRTERGGPVVRLVVVLRGARQRARAERERSDLVASIAHELRSPLTGVKGFVGTLLNKWERLNDQQKLLMLRTVHADSERLSRLITELLDVARIDTGRLSLYPRPVDVAVVAERVIASVQHATTRPLEVRTMADLPTVSFDPDKLVQVLTNLVENGVAHGEGRVLVDLAPLPGEAEETDGSWPGVRVTVTDEGEGIAPGVRKQVFTKFWSTGSRGGSGLGLYIVHGLVTAHGGTVTIDDAPGGGASIELRLPHLDRRRT